MGKGVSMADSQKVRIGGRSLRVSSLDKVLYPSDGTTKGDVLGYYGAIASAMLPHCRDRAATRKRWPNGVGEDGDAAFFFQKDIGEGAPDWVATAEIQHRDHVNTYPLVNDAATLAWLAQLASLEIHVPQWRFGSEREQLNPDRLVLDLDPGPGVDLKQCAAVAVLVRDLLADMGLNSVPVTSGSKGIHVYASLDGRQSSDQVAAVAKELARALEADHPDDITSVMKRSLRAGKVFIDWSQNNASKTTVAPYSLRGKLHPTVAAPRTWRELASPHLRQLDYREVIKRVERRGDPMEARAGKGSANSPDRLEIYRSKRDASATPEPVPDPGADSAEDDDDRVFVIQRHEARALHHDFRIAHDGVLVSWALPKGVPTNPKRNHLAVPTEDHPMSYRFFEGTIPKGEYGAGEVQIWDTGTCEVEKWRDDEVIVTLHGERDGGLGGTRRFALFRTSAEPPQWMIHLMETAPTGTRANASGPGPSSSRQATRNGTTRRAVDAAHRPMLAKRVSVEELKRLNPDEWAFEMKWDGMRVIIDADGERTRLTSRSGADVTPWFPELHELHERLDADEAVLDGEVVALGKNGAPSFQRLQGRMGLEREREINQAMRDVAVQVLLFDVLSINGEDCRRLPYTDRRELLDSIVPAQKDDVVSVPSAVEGTADDAIRISGERHLEGVVAKRRTSPYRSGARSPQWLKHPFARTAEVVLIGWRSSEADPQGFASLLVAVPGEDGWQYAGRVSSGFTSAQRRQIRTDLRSAERKNPAASVPAADHRDATWVTPTLVGEVSFRDRTDEGRFRHPVWRGFRPDKDPDDLN